MTLLAFPTDQFASGRKKWRAYQFEGAIGKNTSKRVPRPGSLSTTTGATVGGDNPVKKLDDEIWPESFDITPEADKQRLRAMLIDLIDQRLPPTLRMLKLIPFGTELSPMDSATRRRRDRQGAGDGDTDGADT